jgi:hypothetical protein
MDPPIRSPTNAPSEILVSHPLLRMGLTTENGLQAEGDFTTPRPAAPSGRPGVARDGAASTKGERTFARCRSSRTQV